MWRSDQLADRLSPRVTKGKEKINIPAQAQLSIAIHYTANKYTKCQDVC